MTKSSLAKTRKIFRVKGPSKTRVIDGKNWRLGAGASELARSEAGSYAKSYRRNGFNARIISYKLPWGSTAYAVYYRKSSK